MEASRMRTRVWSDDVSGIPYYETSSKEGFNVEAAFECIAKSASNINFNRRKKNIAAAAAAGSSNAPKVPSSDPFHPLKGVVVGKGKAHADPPSDKAHLRPSPTACQGAEASSVGEKRAHESDHVKPSKKRPMASHRAHIWQTFIATVLRAWRDQNDKCATLTTQVQKLTEEVDKSKKELEASKKNPEAEKLK
ncbi:Uncharacterized protein Fot_21708 [Forsythia ovata]|uniref:Uncharacterized protein n=1 Tax=Forsythia ovata TaxID=205694 RepID=A0ABD1UVM6_9LAMI